MFEKILIFISGVIFSVFLKFLDPFADDLHQGIKSKVFNRGISIGPSQTNPELRIPTGWYQSTPYQIEFIYTFNVINRDDYEVTVEEVNASIDGEVSDKQIPYVQLGETTIIASDPVIGKRK